MSVFFSPTSSISIYKKKYQGEAKSRGWVCRASKVCVVCVSRAHTLCACVGHLILLSTFLGYLFNTQMITN